MAYIKNVGGMGRGGGGASGMFQVPGSLGMQGYSARASMGIVGDQILGTNSGGKTRLNVKQEIGNLRATHVTPEQANIAAWGNKMGAPRGTGEGRLSGYTPPKSFRQQGLGKAEVPENITPEEFALQEGVSLNEARAWLAFDLQNSADLFHQNRGVKGGNFQGDAPEPAMVVDRATPEMVKGVLARSPSRFGSPSEEEIKALTERINSEMDSTPGRVWRLRDIEGRLIGGTDIHHEGGPFWSSGTGTPDTWSGMANRANMRLGGKFHK